MNARTLLIASSILNLVLLAAVAGYTRPKPVPAAAPAPQTASVPTTRKSVARTDVAPQPADTSPAFHWRQVEAEDYKRYIANLRAIGCPEETIRDIIVADVTKLFAQKLNTAARAKDFKYWQNTSSRQRLTNENRRLARDLDRERWVLLRDLLGPDAEAEYRKTALSGDTATDEVLLGFLPDSKRAAVRDIVERYADLEQELARKGGALTQKERADLKQLRERRATELAAVLTPEELLDYELRTSGTADNLRTRLAGVDVSETQFRDLHRLQKSFDDEFSRDMAVMDAKAAQRRMEAQRKLEDDFKAALGEPLYNEMRRAQDPAWRGLVEVAREQNVSPATMEKVYEMKKLVEENLRATMTDPNVPRESRAAAVKSIGEQTEQALVQLLGQAGWEAYKQNGGYWVPGQQGNAVTYRTMSATGNNVESRGYSFDTATTTSPNPSGASGTSGSGGSGRQVIIQSGTPPAKP